MIQSDEEKLKSVSESDGDNDAEFKNNCGCSQVSCRKQRDESGDRKSVP